MEFLPDNPHENTTIHRLGHMMVDGIQIATGAASRVFARFVEIHPDYRAQIDALDYQEPMIGSKDSLNQRQIRRLVNKI